MCDSTFFWIDVSSAPQKVYVGSYAMLIFLFGCQKGFGSVVGAATSNSRVTYFFCETRTGTVHFELRHNPSTCFRSPLVLVSPAKLLVTRQCFVDSGAIGKQD